MRPRAAAALWAAALALAVAAGGGEQQTPADPEPQRLCRLTPTEGQPAASAEELRRCRVRAVKAAIAHAWHGYASQGWGSDDFSPLTGRGVENWHARSTIYDSLDTLWLAEMHAEFDTVMAELRWRGPPLQVLEPTKLFEYNIRVIGGLLGGYTLSREPALLQAAADAADALLACAEQYGEALPMPTGRLVAPGQPLRNALGRAMDRITRRVTGTERGTATLAGAGSFTLEMRYLSRETGDGRYAAFAERMYWEMVGMDADKHGDVPSSVNRPDDDDDDDDDDDEDDDNDDDWSETDA